MNIIHAEIDREMRENTEGIDDGNYITCVLKYDFDSEEIEIEWQRSREDTLYLTDLRE